MTNSLYALPLFWSVSAYVVNIQWSNRLAPNVRALMEATIKEVEDAQWKLGLEQTEDGIACNTGNRDACKLGRVPDANPMQVFRPVPADTETMRQTLTATILPNWVRRCGARCGEVYNRVVAPITGVRLSAN